MRKLNDLIDSTRRFLHGSLPDKLVWEPEVIGSLYPDRPFFLTAIRKGVSLMPSELQQAFADEGYKIYVCRRAHKIMGNQDISNKLAELMKLYEPDPGRYLDKKGQYTKLGKFKLGNRLYMNEGFAILNAKLMVMPQASMNGTLLKPLLNIIFRDNTVHTTTHEIGHLFAVLCEKGNGDLGEKDVFKKLIDKDLDKARLRGKFSLAVINDGTFLLNKGKYFYDEMLAEIFADIMTGRKRASKVFPETAEFIQQRIDDVCAEVRMRNNAASENPPAAPSAHTL